MKFCLSKKSVVTKHLCLNTEKDGVTFTSCAQLAVAQRGNLFNAARPFGF